MTEIWKPVPGWKDFYEVSDHGNVRSLDRVVVDANGRQMKFRGQSLKLFDNKRGYFKVTLSKGNILCNGLVHQLVAAAFIGPRPKGMDTCHNDGDRRNNHISNLRYDTRKNNLEDMIIHGTSLSGEKNVNAKLTADDVQFIRSCPHSNRELSEHFLISRSQVERVRNGQRWGHVS